MAFWALLALIVFGIVLIFVHITVPLTVPGDRLPRDVRCRLARPRLAYRRHPGIIRGQRADRAALGLVG